MDPNTPTTVYAGTYAGVFKSLNSGDISIENIEKIENLLKQLDSHRIDVRLKQAKPILHELAEKSGETAYVSILRADDVVYLDSVEASTTVRVVSRLGLHMPIHSTAAGKAIITYESEEEIRKRFNREMARFTPNTLTTVDDLLKNLKVARERGYAADLEEFEEGLRCIAAPIRDYTRKVIGALSISGPAHRLTDEKIESFIGPEVVRCGQDLSRRLGYRE